MTLLLSNPRIELLESIGYGQYGPASEQTLAPGHPVHLCGEDVHSGLTAAAFPIPANNDGTPSYSYERWIRVRFTPPFGLITALRFWVTLSTPIPAGWSLLWGYSNGYQVPTNAMSTIAQSTLPTTDPGHLMPNLGDQQFLRGTHVCYSSYIVLQASFVPEQITAGSLMEPLPGVTYNVAYLQT